MNSKISLLSIYFTLCIVFSQNATAQKLTPPVITSVVAGNESVTISWDPVPGATGYMFYWSDRCDVNLFNMFRGKVEVLTNSFKQTQLANGVRYYFIVQAISNKGSSYASLTATAIPTSSPKSAQDNTIVIRPFGDSITFGIGFSPNDRECTTCVRGQSCPTNPVDWGGGYRGWMTLILANNKITTFTTEGSQCGGSTIMQWNNSTQKHDGYPGKRTDQMISYSKMPSQADVTLIHLGTNDIIQRYGWSWFWIGSYDQAADSLYTIINNILTVNPKTKVYVAKIIKFFPGTMVLPNLADSMNKRVDLYNQLIVKKWNTLSQEFRSRVFFVDMNSVLTSASDYSDGVHPNRSGYLKMSCAWIRAFTGTYPQENLGNPCSCITNDAVTKLMPQQPTN